MLNAERTCGKGWKRSSSFGDKVTDHLSGIISMKLRGRNKLGVDREMSGTERNGENVLESKSAYTEEEVGQRLQLLIFLIGDLNVCVCIQERFV